MALLRRNEGYDPGRGELSSYLHGIARIWPGGASSASAAICPFGRPGTDDPLADLVSRERTDWLGGLLGLPLHTARWWCSATCRAELRRGGVGPGLRGGDGAVAAPPWARAARSAAAFGPAHTGHGADAEDDAMSCEDFEDDVVDLARGEELGDAERTEALAHAEECCGAPRGWTTSAR